MQQQESLTQLRTQIDCAMVADQPRLRDQVRRTTQLAQRGKPFDRNLTRLEQAIEKSVTRARQRDQRRPRVNYPEELPVTARRDDIARAIAENQVVIVAGATGSGKSTQLPKICLDLGRGVRGLIGHTQPRRLAARSLAGRVAEELGSSVGEHVGFKIRFTDATSERSYVKLMTDGILLAETQGDPDLLAYDTLILDEAHERSLNIDFLLGYIKQLLPRRPELKLIITSATIDPERFAEHFADAGGNPAPIIEVSGRTYPVDLRYRPLETEDEETDDRDLQQAIRDAIHELMAEDPGDILVFLPTERDIRETARALQPAGHHRTAGPAGTEVLPLYARLSAKEQARIFQPHPNRRVVLATNVAETSLTVPGIRHVIDTGLARISRFSARSGVQRLPIEAISQASADQRKGRCGRTSPGICIRLYDEDDFASREAFTPPEILRTNLAAVILQMKALRLGSIENFPFLDPPRPAMVRNGYRTLHELGAISEEGEVTDVGKTLSRLPTDPRIGRMVLAGHQENALAEVLVIAAALEAQEPRVRPPEKQQAADEAHARFQVPGSDFLSYLKLWDFYHEQKQKLSRSRLKKACAQNFLSYNRLREWADVHRQLKQLAKDAGLKLRQRHDKPEPIHRALLTGLLSHVAMRGSGHEYTGSGGKKLFIWPGSSLFDAKPKWLMAAELVETSRLFARTAAQINPAWIEPVAGHLVKRSYSEPRWQRETGHVMAYEKVSLFGLPLAARRPANYGKVNPAHAREIFIHEGLVEGEYDTHAPFFHHNAELLEKVRTLQAKARRGDILARMQARFDFYDQRLPKTVTSGPDLDTWRKKAERDNPRLLFMSEADLLAGPADEVTEERFPDALEVGGARLPLEYHLEPGTDEDGVTLAVPLETLNQVDDQQIEWLVPGLLEEKVLAMIRSLPKAIRRNFAPAPDWAKRVTARLRFGEGSLRHAVARTLSEFSTAQVPPSAFRMDALPDHLQLAVRAIDDQGEPIATSRDLGELREKFASQAADRFASLGQADLTQEGLTSWSFGELPQSVEVQRGSMQMTGYPALVDEEQSVALRVLDTPQRASFETHRGLRRLFYLQVEPEVRYRVQHLPQLGRLKLQAATLPDQDRLESQLGLLITERAFLTDDQPIRDAAAFEDRLNTGWNRLGKVAHEVAQQITRILDAYQQASLALSEANAPQWQTALQDMRGQLECLVARGFLTQTPYPWLMQYPRYLSGICKRIEKLQTGRLDRDRESYQQLLPHWQRYIQRAQTHAQRGILDIQLVGYRWMIEEYRISLFAQELGTALPVSPRRLEKQWQQVAGE